MKPGDAIATVATPIARAMKMDCIDPETNDLRPDSTCAQRRDKINQFAETIFDCFWPSSKPQPE